MQKKESTVTKIIVTGGTGFVGCHTVSRLVNDGHEIRLLVRSKKQVGLSLAPLSVDSSKLDIIQGDVTDRSSVTEALDGMDGVIHSASVYSMDKRRTNEINTTNTKGAEIVLGEASEAGLDPIVHVSSITAILSPIKRTVISSEALPTPVKVGPYVDSKTEQEIVARKLQSQGAPIVITYPGAVMGPHDPHWGDGPFLVESILRNKVPIAINNRLPIVDVRDLAHLHSDVMKRGQGPRRFIMSGTPITFIELVSLLRQLTCRKIPCATIPSWILQPAVGFLDRFHRTIPFRIPITNEGLTILKSDLKFDDSPTTDELGMEKTDLKKTMKDMVEWMHSTGRIPNHLAGTLLS